VILVDSSVWIETFKKRRPLDLLSVVEFSEVATCLPVIQEVLQGFRDEAAFRRAEEAMLALPRVESPLTESLYREAIELFRTGRSLGVTIRSSVACLIAACALRHGLTILHRDRDFDQIAGFTRLAVRGV
jgi:predicted nucleic acid-binding protein